VLIVVIRTDEQYHRGLLVRGDDDVVPVPIADHDDALPHDIVHYAVERALGIDFGFWGLLAAGARLESVARTDARTPRSIQVGSDALVAAHMDDLLLAEGLVAAFTGTIDESSLDENLSGDQIAHVQATIAVLDDAWRSLPVGENLELPW
jgi:hypothetical protein